MGRLSGRTVVVDPRRRAGRPAARSCSRPRARPWSRCRPSPSSRPADGGGRRCAERAPRPVGLGGRDVAERRRAGRGRGGRPSRRARPCAGPWSGPGTADALAALGIHAALVPDRFVAEGLVEAFPDPPAGGGRVLLAQAEAARPVLADGLRARGWDGRRRRGLPDGRRSIPPPELVRAAAAADAVAFTSGSTVDGFVRAAGAGAVPSVVVAIGPVTCRGGRRPRPRRWRPRRTRTRWPASSRPRWRHCRDALRGPSSRRSSSTSTARSPTPSPSSTTPSAGCGPTTASTTRSSAGRRSSARRGRRAG